MNALMTALDGFFSSLDTDNFTLTDENLVTIWCPQRGKSFSAPLCSPFQLNGIAQWESLGASPLGNVLGVVDKAAGALTGTTIKQPWFARKYWKGTDPLSFSFVMDLWAKENAEKEVFRPCETLVGFLYPRNNPSAGSGVLRTFIPPGPNLFTGYNSEGKMSTGLLSEALDSSPGDYFSITVGNMLYLELCYINTVSVNFSPVLDETGFPHQATVTVSVTSFDSGVVGHDGSYSISQSGNLALTAGQLKDSVCEIGKQAIDKAKDVVGNVAEGFKDILKNKIPIL